MGTKTDVFEFKGAKAMSQTVATTTVSDQSDSYECGTARLTITGHGYLAGSLIYLSGFTGVLSYLNGLKKILAIDTNTIDVSCRQGEVVVTADPGGTEVARCVVTLDEDYTYEGFSLHLNAASATAEDFEISVDAAKGSEFDNKLYDQDMEGLQDVVDKPDADEAVDMKANDLLVATWANSNSKTWGLRFFVRRKS